MTITRELQSATIKAYGPTTDTYGQLEKGTPTTRPVEVMVRIYSQQNVTDPRYVDVELVALTKDKGIVPGEVLSLAQGDYRIKYVIPTGRWTELMLAKL